MLEITILKEENKVLKREVSSLKRKLEKCQRPREKVDLLVYFNQGKEWTEKEEETVWLFFNKYSSNNGWGEIVRTKEEVSKLSLKMGRTVASLRVRNAVLRKICRNFSFYQKIFSGSSNRRKVS